VKSRIGLTLIIDLATTSMVNLLPAWLAKSSDAFRQLAERPFTLFLLLVALNALARPYCNCAHDARLYSLQVINQVETGAFADDVFLRYGSQDKFSFFSSAVAPMAATLGIRETFFALYLVFNTIFLWGLFRFIRALFADPMISTAALIYLVTSDLFYGGHGIFAVHEQFFTPRLIATGLVFHALERIVKHGFIVAAVLLAVAIVMHPLMALGGVLVWGGYVARLWVPTKWFYGSFAAVSVLALAVLAIEPISVQFFGYMDDDWHEMVRRAVLYNYPDAWSRFDWTNQLLAFAVAGAGIVWLFRGDVVRERFLLIATLAGIVGLTATALASWSPYALLFQGQPYRVVWILKVLQVPLAFMVFSRCCQSTALLPRLAALGLAAFFLIVHYGFNELVIFMAVFPLAAFYWRVMDDATRPDWLWRACLTTLYIGAVGWLLYRWAFVFANLDTILGFFDKADLIRVLLQMIPGVLWLTLVFFAIRWVQSNGEAARLRWVCLIAAFALPTFFFAIEQTPAGRSEFTRYGDDIVFARRAIDQQRGNQSAPPSIYCSLGHAEYVWLDLHGTSYFDIVQTAGVMFQRETALELKRRIHVVRNFEMARLRKETLFIAPECIPLIEKFHEAKFEDPEPTETDLVRLCQEPGLDYVVIPQEYPGLYLASNGRIFVYECEKVKNSTSSARIAASEMAPPALQRAR
jgi:hypothetical protein